MVINTTKTKVPWMGLVVLIVLVLLVAVGAVTEMDFLLHPAKWFSHVK